MMDHSQDVKCIAWHPHEEASYNRCLVSAVMETAHKAHASIPTHRSSLLRRTTLISTYSSTTRMGIGVPSKNSTQNSQQHPSPSPPAPHPSSPTSSSLTRLRTEYRCRRYWRTRLSGAWLGVLVGDTWRVVGISVVSGFGHDSES